MTRAEREEMPDEDLLRGARGGDFEAFCQLFRRHRDRAYRALGGAMPAREAFIRLHRRLGRWDLRESFEDAVSRELAGPSAAPRAGRKRVRPQAPAVSGVISPTASPSESEWEREEAILRAEIGAAPLQIPAWLRFERWQETSMGARVAGWSGALAILAVSVYAGWPAFKAVPLPPYASTVIPAAALTQTPLALPQAPTPARGNPAIMERMRLRGLLHALPAESGRPLPAGKLIRVELKRPGIRPKLGELAEFVVRLTEPSDIRAMVTTRGGDLVQRIIEAHFPAGEHRFAWDGRDGVGQTAIPGIYTLQVTTDRWGEQCKILVLE